MVILRSTRTAENTSRVTRSLSAAVIAAATLTPFETYAEGPRRDQNVVATPNPTANNAPPITATPTHITPPQASGITLEILGQNETIRTRRIRLTDSDTGVFSIAIERINEVGMTIPQRERIEQMDELRRGPGYSLRGMGPLLVTARTIRMESPLNPRYQGVVQYIETHRGGSRAIWAHHRQGTPTVVTPVRGQEWRSNVSLGTPDIDIVIARREENGGERYYLAMQIGPRPVRVYEETTQFGSGLSNTTRNLEMRGVIRIVDITQYMQTIGYAPNSELRVTGRGTNTHGSIVIFSSDSQGRISRGVQDGNGTYSIGIDIMYGIIHSETDPSVGGRILVSPRNQ